MKILSMIAVALAALTLTGCAAYRPNGAYGIYFENAYLSSCEMRARVSYCTCTLGYLEQHVSVQQVAYDGNNMAQGGQLPGYMQTAASVCQWAVL